jgi:hypothetical protein
MREELPRFKTELNSEGPETIEEACQRIAFAIVEEAPKLSKLLVLMQRTDGSGRSIDTGLTVDQAKFVVMSFHSWLDQCLGREMERNGK